MREEHPHGTKLVMSTPVIVSVISTTMVKAILRTSVINAQQQWCNSYCSRTVMILVHSRNHKDINCRSRSSSSSSSSVE
ncbi:hypothetical protein V1478_017561 [Vespula squamosa]|uniref:Uncharacterized protein n=1 Tax=Vespula squamosa TaxID=30214 RepID=A0ABD1ZZS7_VESSQ